jgi:hypothetical protein
MVSSLESLFKQPMIILNNFIFVDLNEYADGRGGGWWVKGGVYRNLLCFKKNISYNTLASAIMLLPSLSI